MLAVKVKLHTFQLMFSNVSPQGMHRRFKAQPHCNCVLWGAMAACPYPEACLDAGHNAGDIVSFSYQNNPYCLLGHSKLIGTKLVSAACWHFGQQTQTQETPRETRVLGTESVLHLQQVQADTQDVLHIYRYYVASNLRNTADEARMPQGMHVTLDHKKRHPVASNGFI